MKSLEEKLESATKWYNGNKSLFDSCAFEVSNIIEKIIKQNEIAYQSITNRVKEKDSFTEKCKKDKYVNPETEITDLVGIRIITYTNREVINICKIIEEEFDIDKNNSVNKAEKLEDDKVGYLSVHYVAKLNKNRYSLPEYAKFKDVWVEIQVRTLLQHAWAEIEHDKSYKFSGELRKDLKRKFFLIAGVLELMDQEFVKLSEDIDEYAKNVNESTQNGNFDIDIDSTSLQEYMKNKFGILDETPGNNIAADLIFELNEYGLYKLKDIEEIVKPNYKDVLSNNTYYGILRDFMIINDATKYFKKAFRNRWGVSINDVELYRKYGIDILPYVNQDELYDEGDLYNEED